MKKILSLIFLSLFLIVFAGMASAVSTTLTWDDGSMGTRVFEYGDNVEFNYSVSDISLFSIPDAATSIVIELIANDGTHTVNLVNDNQATWGFGGSDDFATQDMMAGGYKLFAIGTASGAGSSSSFTQRLNFGINDSLSVSLDCGRNDVDADNIVVYGDSLVCRANAFDSRGREVPYVEMSFNSNGNELTCNTEDNNNCVVKFNISEKNFDLGDYEVEVTAEKEYFTSATNTDSFTVDTSLQGPLTISLDCNDDVVIGDSDGAGLFFCGVTVTDKDNNTVRGANVAFKVVENEFSLGQAVTDDKGKASVEVVLTSGDFNTNTTYTVKANASKQSYDSAFSNVESFYTWEERYSIEELRVFNDESYSLEDAEDYDFFRGEAMFVSFKIKDMLSNTYVENMEDLDVFLRANDETADFEVGSPSKSFWDILFGASPKEEGLYYFSLDAIPESDSFLGNSIVFSFVFNNSDETAGQSWERVTLYNREIEFDITENLEVKKGSNATIDMAEFITEDDETSIEDMIVTLNDGYTLPQGISVDIVDTVVTVTASQEAEVSTPWLHFTADDTDGSVVSDNLQLNIVEDSSYDLTAVISGPDSALVDEEVTFDGSQSEGTYEIVDYAWSVSVNGAQVQQEESPKGLSDTYTAVFDSAGTYIVTLTVTDSEDNIASTTHNVVVTEDNGLTAVISGPDSALVDEEVTFDGYDSTGDIDDYTWTVRKIPVDGSTDEAEMPKGLPDGGFQMVEYVTYSHTFTSTGTYRVTLTVSDIEGNTDVDTHDIVITSEDMIPVAVIEGPNVVNISEKVTYTGINSYAETGYEIVSYQWTITNAQNTINYQVSGESINYYFLTKETYEVSLVVEDNRGFTSDPVSIQVEVIEGESPVVVSSPQKGIKVTSLELYGYDFEMAHPGDDIFVRATIENFADVDLENVRMILTMPEIGVRFKSSAIDVEVGDTESLTIAGFLPYDIEPGYYYPTIEFSDKSIRRSIAGYLEVVEE